MTSLPVALDRGDRDLARDRLLLVTEGGTPFHTVCQSQTVSIMWLSLQGVLPEAYETIGLSLIGALQS